MRLLGGGPPSSDPDLRAEEPGVGSGNYTRDINKERIRFGKKMFPNPRVI